MCKSLVSAGCLLCHAAWQVRDFARRGRQCPLKTLLKCPMWGYLFGWIGHGKVIASLKLWWQCFEEEPSNQARILRLANNLVSNCKFVTPPRTLSFGSHCLTLPLTRLKFGWTWLLPGTFLLREICQKSFGQPPFLERNTLTVLEVALFFTQVQLKLFTFAVEYSKRGTEFNEAMRCCERWESSINDVRYILKQWGKCLQSMISTLP